MPKPQTLLCTVGTSLLGNLKREPDGPLTEAFRAQRWPDVAAALRQLTPTDRVCGAEINSVASLLQLGHVAADVGLLFFHSATDDGRAVAAVLKAYYDSARHSPVLTVEIDDLQDADPRRFRTRGLRNLARHLCRAARDYSAAACAINATGGYKAQIAIAVVLGQVLGVPVWYKHEAFDEVISFPPLPVAFDIEVWMAASGLLFALERAGDMVPLGEYADEWDERWEGLVEREQIDGEEYVALSATGQVFHEAFRERFRTGREQFLPPAAIAKKEPILKSNEAHMLKHRDEIVRFLRQVTEEVGPVALCKTVDFHHDRPKPTRFVETCGHVEGVYSPGSWMVRFLVETTATTEGQRRAVVARLNEWLASQE